MNAEIPSPSHLNSSRIPQLDLHKPKDPAQLLEKMIRSFAIDVDGGDRLCPIE